MKSSKNPELYFYNASTFCDFVVIFTLLFYIWKYASQSNNEVHTYITNSSPSCINFNIKQKYYRNILMPIATINIIMYSLRWQLQKICDLLFNKRFLYYDLLYQFTVYSRKKVKKLNVLLCQKIYLLKC